MEFLKSLFSSSKEMKMPEDLSSLDLSKRQVFLEGEITFESFTSIAPKLLYLDYVNKKPIRLFINSPGGGVMHSLWIYDTIKYLKSDVETICNGFSSGMATLLLSSGKKGSRFCCEDSRITLCEFSLMNDYISNEVENAEINYLIDSANEILTKNIGQTIGRIKEDSKFWSTTNGAYELLPKEAISYGIIDKIYKESA